MRRDLVPAQTVDRPLRVLYLDHTATLGGGEIALLHLASNLDRKRYTPIVVLSSYGALLDRLREAGVETHVLPLHPYIVSIRKDSLGPRSATRARTLLRIVLYSIRIAGFVRRQGIDLIHTNSLKSDIFGGLAARLARVPVIWHLRDRISEDYLPRWVVRVFRLLCRHLPNFVIANSAATLETLMLPKSKPSAVVYSGRLRSQDIYDGIAAPLQSRAETDGDRIRRAPRIGLVGRISPWKGQHIFIRAAQKVCARFPCAQFFIAGSALFGEEAYEAEIHRLVTECGLEDRICFLGFRSDVDALVASFDVLVHASTAPEPLGQVVIEGMAGGTPVVATRGGGVMEILEDGVTGSLVAMGSVDEMADAIMSVLCHPARASSMADAAMKVVIDRYTIEKTVANVQSVYACIQRRG